MQRPHLIITTHSYRHPASPQLSYCALRSAFDQVELLPRQVWADRILYEAQETADPVHLVLLFGIHPKYRRQIRTRHRPGQGPAKNPLNR
ncbi:hypothetical protein [Streptomyces sp. NPDC004267]|uniref:hypothetical protein n=1 Tax=Streptomyces sp. NPDC004267 TaxID=3364694 RepID=UPI003698628B